MSGSQSSSDIDEQIAQVRRELDEAHKAIRALVRQLSKEQARHHEAARAYSKTVSNLMEMARENTALAAERDQLKAQMVARPTPFSGRLPLPDLSAEEARAIRRAMQRLYSADAGDDPARLRMWGDLLSPREG